MLRLVCILIGYCFGLIQSAYIIGRIKGIDIRNYGSGNAGTTNAMRVMGTKAGLVVFVMDILKCIVAILLVTALFGKAHPEAIYLLKTYTLAGCVLGHDYPFYMKFKGGKGVAVIAGFVIAFHWTFLPVAIIVFTVPFVLTHYVSLGSLLLYTACLVLMIIEGSLGVFTPAAQPVLIEMYIVMGVLTAMAFSKHRANIKRLFNGTERKTYILHHEKDSQ